ncbi:hypothetical protein VTK56DRAFT_7765 [Thermocarpiscus australiensis]
MAAPEMIDPTKPAKYPVILSDALLGKPSNEAYTAVRYNHRPTLSSDTAPNTAWLKKSARDGSYNLGFDDQGNRYQYNGVRTSNDSDYVLIFDPARKAFVLHRVDSTFHMNLTRTPTDNNVESLRKQFPHLEVKTASSSKEQYRKGTNKTGASTAATPQTKDGSTFAEDKPNGYGKSEKSKPVALTLPDLTAGPSNPASPSPPPPPGKKSEPPTAPPEPEKKPKRRAASPVESEEEDDDDDDGGLTVEYPDGNPSAYQATSHFSPAFPVAVTRRFSEFARDIENGEEDEDTGVGYDGRVAGGYEEGSEEEKAQEEEAQQHPQKPPSPAQKQGVDNPVAVEPDRYTFDDGDEDENDALDQDFGDLEAELEREFDRVQNEGHESDSSVSEEE